MSKKSKLIKTLIAFIILFSVIICSKTYAADIVVALDPGHDGADSGATGGNLVERELNWKIATRVKEILDNTPGIRGVLTISHNETIQTIDANGNVIHETVGRQERANRAKANNADLLVSFHINSNNSSTRLSGAEVYVTNSTAKKRYYEYSSILARDVLDNLRSIGVRSYTSTPRVRVGADWDKYDDGTIADYYGIISWPIHNDIPAILIEHAFINNPYDRQYYLNDYMLGKMAEADAKAIIKNKDLFAREYNGSINTQLDSINQIKTSSGADYITGKIDIAEWVNGICQTPSGTPKLTLKSTDGTFSEDMYVNYERGITYYFDKNITGINMDKEYYIEAELTGKNNVSPRNQKIQRVYLKNQVLNKNYNNRKLKILNNRIVFSEGEYVGDIQTNLQQLNTLVSNNNKYISGIIDIKEIVDGKSRVPRTVPEIRIKSTDGTYNLPTYIAYQKENQYYFDRDVQNIDSSKQYYIEVSLKTEENISKNKTQKVIIEDKLIGKYDDMQLNSKNHNLIFTYQGTINTELRIMNVIRNSKQDRYISGRIDIAEYVNNECRKPTTMPVMVLKSTDGTIEKNAYLYNTKGIEYYYDIDIENLDLTKKYYFEVKLTNPNNVSEETKKIQVAYITEKNNVEAYKYQVQINNNQFEIIDKSKYVGNINTELRNINIIKSSSGADFISGRIDIAEYVNNICNKPQKTPEMTLKSTDGTYSKPMYIVYERGITYYFDRNIEGIDINKEYYIEVKLNNKDNIATEAQKTQVAQIDQKGQIGVLTNTDKVIIENNNIIKIERNIYKGSINTELKNTKIIKSASNLDYLMGYIDIGEYINGICNKPLKTPKMTLKSTDGTYSEPMYISYEKGITYYFDRNIEGIDKTKKYYIEIKLTDENNTETDSNKTQIVYFNI